MSVRAARGPYSKGVARREAIVDAATALFARNGYNATSMREIAAAAGLGPTGLLHHFANKEEVLLAVTDQRQAEQEVLAAQRQGEDRPWQDLAREVLERNLSEPQITQLWIVLLAETIDASHPAHDHLAARAELTVRVFSQWFASDAGFDEPLEEHIVKARLLMGLWEGLEAQWLRDRSFDPRPAFNYALVMLSRYSQYK